MRLNNILLIQPPKSEVLESPNLSVLDAVKYRAQPAYGLWCLASAITREFPELNAEIFDINLEVLDHWHQTRETRADVWIDLLKRKIETFSPDRVGISCLFATETEFTIEIAGIVKNSNPDSVVCVGGPQVTSLTTRFLECDDIDFAVLREGERPIVSLVRALRDDTPHQEIPSLCFRDPDLGDVVNALEPYPKDLGEYLPFLDAASVPFDRYAKRGRVSGLIGVKGLALPYETSRGCPYECTYCAAPSLWDRRLRYKSIEFIDRELDSLLKQAPFKHIYLQDDVPFLKKTRTIELLQLFKSKDLIPHFPNSLRVNSLDEEIIDALGAAGVPQINIAVESGSQQVLKKLMRKKVDLDHANNMIRYARENTDIKMSGNILFGMPGETLEDMEETLIKIRELPVDIWHFGSVVPIPGSEIYDDLIGQGVHFDSMNSWNAAKGNIVTEDFSPEDVEALIERANEELNFKENVNVREGKYARAKWFFEHVLAMAPEHKSAQKMLSYVEKKIQLTS